MKNTTRAATATGTAATVTGVLSVILGGKLAKYGIPLDQGAVIAGGIIAPVFAWIGKWAAKLDPHG